jgi:hypothetical protein
VIKLRPMLRKGATDAERRLLRSARLDVPSASGKNRALAALGLAAAATTSVSTGGVAAAATAWAGWVVKCIAVATVGGALVASAVAGVSSIVSQAPQQRSRVVANPTGTISQASVAQPSRAQALPAPITSPSMSIQQARPDREPNIMDQAAPVPKAPEATQGARPLLRDARPDAPAPVESSRPMGATLSQEVGALDEARRALASGDPKWALQVLDTYELRVATPRLKPEATVLRVEALLSDGRLDRARELGEGLLAKNPDGAYAQRVRSLLASVAR